MPTYLGEILRRNKHLKTDLIKRQFKLHIYIGGIEEGRDAVIVIVQQRFYFFPFPKSLVFLCPSQALKVIVLLRHEITSWFAYRET